jgi:hypothetical protein
MAVTTLNETELIALAVEVITMSDAGKSHAEMVAHIAQHNIAENCHTGENKPSSWTVCEQLEYLIGQVVNCATEDFFVRSMANNIAIDAIERYTDQSLGLDHVVGTFVVGGPKFTIRPPVN